MRKVLSCVGGLILGMAVFPVWADVVQLTQVSGIVWESQTFSVAGGGSVDFGDVVLTSVTPSCPLLGTCFVPGVPYGEGPLYGPAPTFNQISNWLWLMTSGGAIAPCEVSSPCREGVVSPPIPLVFDVPPGDGMLTLLFYSWAEPVIVASDPPGDVPLPASLWLFLTGVIIIFAYGRWRWL